MTQKEYIGKISQLTDTPFVPTPNGVTGGQLLGGGGAVIGKVVESPIKSMSEIIRARVMAAGDRFHASDNIAHHIYDDIEKQALIKEATTKFEAVLDALVIDRHNDPNSQETGKRLAKMYINELFEGRYTERPRVAAFPNTGEGKFRGVLVAHAELRSVCSHHHQPVIIKCYIGIIPSDNVIGLSKYTRIAQHCARRGTLQEELTNDIAEAIIAATGSDDVAVQLVGKHGCMENRGCMANNSGTYTAVMRGEFYNSSVRDEFFHAIKQIESNGN